MLNCNLIIVREHRVVNRPRRLLRDIGTKLHVVRITGTVRTRIILNLQFNMRTIYDSTAGILYMYHQIMTIARAVCDII